MNSSAPASAPELPSLGDADGSGVHRRGRAARGRPRGESGLTLVDLILSVVLLGTIGVAILDAIQTSLVLSDRNRKDATSDVLLRDYVEGLKLSVSKRTLTNAADPNSWCLSATTYPVVNPSTPATSFTAPSGYSMPQQTLGACPTGSTPTPVQTITVVASPADGRATEKVVILVRPACETSSC